MEFFAIADIETTPECLHRERLHSAGRAEVSS